jgi:hypothetical protein
MAFFDEFYPEPVTMQQARQSMHVTAWIDLIFWLIFMLTYLFTLGLSWWWLGFFELLHAIGWSFAICVADGRSGAFAMTLANIIFVILIIGDTLSLIIRFWFRIWLATSPPILEVIFEFETLLLLISGVALFLAAQELLYGFAYHDAACRKQYAEQEQLARLGSATMADMAQAVRIANNQQALLAQAPPPPSSAIFDSGAPGATPGFVSTQHQFSVDSRDSGFHSTLVDLGRHDVPG